MYVNDLFKRMAFICIFLSMILRLLFYPHALLNVHIN